VVVVDSASLPDEDRDGDRHFKTLQAALQGPPAPNAYDTILIEPGRYEGDLQIQTEGLILRSTGGASQTVLAGRVFIRARKVLLEGLSIEGNSSGPAVTISAPGVTLEGNRIYGSRVGVLIEGANEVALEKNQIYNHAHDGFVARDAWNLKLQENDLRGNGGLGVWIENSRDARLEKNSLSFNQLGGVWLKGSQRAVILSNTIRDNRLVGIALEGTSDSQANENQLVSNEAGILLINSVNNEIHENEIRQHYVAGLVLKNGAQGNAIEKNLVQGNQGRGGAGVRLSGNVFSNRLVSNRLMENGVGLVLSANETGSPTNNSFEVNEIARSDRTGVSIEAGSKLNRFVSNKIHHNLESGLASVGEANIYDQNEIYANGGVGMILQNSRDDRLEGNHIYGNGAEGVRLESASNVLLMNNEILENVREGLQLLSGRRLRLSQNTVAQNGASGLVATSMESLSLANNRIYGNGDYGAHVNNASDLTLQENEIEGNGAGGIRLEGVRGADVTANRVRENLHYGLMVSNSEEISARRNFWGDEHGPAGAFAGAGNAVLGLSLDDVTPWLPAEPDELVLSSVSALVIDSPRGPRMEFDASDRLGIILDLYQLGRGEPGRSELLSQGIVIAARYAARPEGVPPLGAEMAFYAVTVEGVDAGTAELTVLYTEQDQPPGVDPEKLQLFALEDGQWQPLSGRADPKLQRVTGEIGVEELDGRLIGLGMFTEQQQLLSSLLPWTGNHGHGARSADKWLASSLLLVTPLALFFVYFFYFFYVPRSRYGARRKALGFKGNRR
jgi:parallel beta-helix repeat protein